MVGKAVKKSLYSAVTKGEVARFQKLLEADPDALDEVQYERSRNLLHIATIHERLGIIEEILKANQQLARNPDSDKSTPLHLAVAQGNVEMAKKLLSAAPELCWSRDGQGDMPLHIAAMNGHVGIVEELIRSDPFTAMERVHRGQTVLHLCVKHRQLQTLKVLVEELGEFACAKDDDGETILHLAVRCNQLQFIRYLVEEKKIKKHTRNSMGKTALDILNESPLSRDKSEIRRILTSLPDQSLVQGLPKMSDMTMVVVVLIATMAFQAAVSPPGGVWQDDTSSHRAGEAVLSYTHPEMYRHLVRANTTAFVSSLLAILLIISGLPSVHMLFMSVASYAMWVSLTSIAVTYGVSMMAIDRYMLARPFYYIVTIFIGCISIMILLWFSVRRMYLSWRGRQRQRGEDLTIDSLIIRVLLLDFPTAESFQRKFSITVGFDITGRYAISYSKGLVIECECVVYCS